MRRTVLLPWQEIDGYRHIGHSWQDRYRRMITDMTFYIIAVATVLVIAATLRSVLHDGRTPRPPRSHRVDPDFVAPAARASYRPIA
jgi:Zn-dependent protease